MPLRSTSCRHRSYVLTLSLLASAIHVAWAAEGDKTLGKVEVTASRESQLGVADTANEGESRSGTTRVSCGLSHR